MRVCQLPHPGRLLIASPHDRTFLASLARFNMADDAELEEAMRLSLVTAAQEEEERRLQAEVEVSQ